MTQCDRIIRHLKDYRTITQRTAMNEYGVMRLASRVSDLKRAGHDITMKMVSAKNRYGEETRFGEYTLHEEQTEQEEKGA